MQKWTWHEWLPRLRDQGFRIREATHAIAGLLQGVIHLHVEPSPTPQIFQVENMALRLQGPTLTQTTYQFITGPVCSILNGRAWTCVILPNVSHPGHEVKHTSKDPSKVGPDGYSHAFSHSSVSRGPRFRQGRHYLHLDFLRIEHTMASPTSGIQDDPQNQCHEFSPLLCIMMK